MTILRATDVGRAVAASGLLPETGYSVLHYLSKRCDDLIALLPQEAKDGDRRALDFCLLFAVLSSPEFQSQRKSRFLHYGLQDHCANVLADRCQSLLSEENWRAVSDAAHAASLLLDWIDGAPLSKLEGRFRDMPAGRVRALIADASWAVTGVSGILAAACGDEATASRMLVSVSSSGDILEKLRRLLPTSRFLYRCLAAGTPAGVVWWAERRDSNGRRLFAREVVLALQDIGLERREELRKRERFNDLVQALKARVVPNPDKEAQRLQEFANSDWTKRAEKKRSLQLARSSTQFATIIADFHNARNSAFEDAFERALKASGIPYEKFDVPENRGQGPFDFLLEPDGKVPIPLECKSTEGDKGVSLNSVYDVVGAADRCGFVSNPCVTLCQPWVDPNVPPQMSPSSRLAIVDSLVMAEAIVRLHEGRLSPEDFLGWLRQRGELLIDTVPTTIKLPG